MFSRPNSLVILGSLSAGTAVLLGAFGAHYLRTRISGESIAVFHTAAQYHFLHSLALLITGALSEVLGKTRFLVAAGRVMMAGMVLFSGSLYIIAVTGLKPVGFVTPLGGVMLVVGWILLALAGAGGSRGG